MLHHINQPHTTQQTKFKPMHGTILDSYTVRMLLEHILQHYLCMYFNFETYTGLQCIDVSTVHAL